MNYHCIYLIILLLLCRSHGIRQVTKSVYQSCDLEGGVIKQWAANRIDGRVTINLPSGRTYYFIDSVAGNCDNGLKMTVSIIRISKTYHMRSCDVTG